MIDRKEAARLLEKQFQDLDRFINVVPGAKKYAYAYAMRHQYSELVMATIRSTWRERNLYNRNKDNKLIDNLNGVLEEGVKEYTYQNMDWGRKKKKYKGYWVGPHDISMENINTVTQWCRHHRRSYPYYHYYSNYFYLNTADSIIFYDVKQKKMVHGNLTTLKHPIFGCLPDSREMLMDILSIQNVDVRKNILSQLSFDYIKYADEVSKSGDYTLLSLDMGRRDTWREPRFRKYLKMINPSTGDVHVEAVHPDCATVQHAINYRRYGTIGVPTIGSMPLPQWSPVQLS